jgi:hypothetical protein
MTRIGVAYSDGAYKRRPTATQETAMRDTHFSDIVGALIDGGGGHQPVSIVGVVNNEGSYESTGNATYYGSVVVGGKVSPQGTQEIWYDACLANDCWPPKHIPFPRVMITSTQIQ